MLNTFSQALLCFNPLPLSGGVGGGPLLFIDWQPSVEAFSVGPVTVRWYALCWVLAILSGFLFVRWMYRQEQIDPAPDKRGKLQPTGKFDPLLFYCFFGIIIGARLGHCIFYEPDVYLTSLQGWTEMLLPIKFDDFPHGMHYTGYAGLASHGGTLGLMIALWLYVRKTKLSIWTVLDNIAIATGTTACFIRFGNLMNSEIIGKITDVPWAFIFEKMDAMPRHPGQLYEAIAYALLFFIMWAIYKRSSQHPSPNTHHPQVGTGWYFGFCLTYIFTFRFFIEYTKEIQEAFEASLPLDMGQILSIPFIIIGVYCMIRAKKVKQ